MAGLRWLTAMVATAIVSMLAIQHVYGEIVCEDLPSEMCAFSVSSAGMRCVLEKYRHGGEMRLQCKTSQVKVDEIAGWVESDRCVDACGVDRSSVGISSDSLAEVQFLERLCSAACYEGCPNIVDLYFNLAAAEGISLHKICESIKHSPRRGMFQTLSSGSVAPAPGSLPPQSEPTPALPPTEPTPASASEPGLFPPPSEPTPAPASEPGLFPPPSEPTPAPASEPASSSEPAPVSEPVPAPVFQPVAGTTAGSEAVTGSNEKKKQNKDKKKKHHKKKTNGDKKKKKKHNEKKKKNHDKKKKNEKKKHDEKKHHRKEHHKNSGNKE